MTRVPLFVLLGLSPVMAAPLEIAHTGEGGKSRVMKRADDEVLVRTKGERTRVMRKADYPRAWAGGFADSLLERKWSPKAEPPPDQAVYYEEGAPRTAANRRFLTNQIILTVPEGGDREALRATLEVLGISARVPEYSKTLVFATLPDPGTAAESLAALKELPGVASAELVWGRSLARQYLPNDPLFSTQWYLNPSDPRNIGAADWWGSYRGKGIRVNVVDDGIETLHPDLTANTDRDNDKDYWDDDGDPNPAAGDSHGTAVAGIIGGRGNNGKGISGIAPECSLIGVRMDFVSSNPIELGDVLKHKSSTIHVSNNSWGPDNDGLLFAELGQPATDALRDGVENGRGGRGVVYVVSAGNDGGIPAANTSRSNFAGNPFVMTVGAVDPSGEPAAFSTPGSNVGVSGWGAGIATTAPQGGYRNDFNGTSAAAPVVSGAVALMIEARPTLTWRDVQDILMRTATKTGKLPYQMNGGGYSFNDKTGAGLVNAERAVRLARSWDLLSGSSTAEVSYRNVAVGITDAKLGTKQTIVPGVTTRTLNLSKNLRANSVLLTVQIEHGNRGDLDIFLTSPSGTTSQMLGHRIADNGTRLSWTFRSVQFWGENSAGDWKVKVVDNNPGPVRGDDRMLEIKLRVMGSNVLPRPVPRGGAVAGLEDAPFRYEASASGNPSRYWASGLPAGLVMDDLGRITGTPLKGGVYQAVIYASNASGTGSAGLTLDIAAGLSPFARWQETWLAGVPADQRGDRDDPDGDGVPNLVEYVSGGNPMEAGPADGLTISSAGEQTWLSWHEQSGIPEYRFLLQGSADLNEWHAVPGTPEAVAGDKGTFMKLLLDPASPLRYFRLKAFLL